MFVRLRGSWRRLLRSQPIVGSVASILFWLPTGFAFTKYCYTITTVTGECMKPTLNPDTSSWRDIVIIDRLSRILSYGRYARGDAVVLKSPFDPNVWLLKRILALEGDIVVTSPPHPYAEICIPRGHMWVEGDEPFHSHDSNQFGPVPLALVDSKAIFVIWPFSRFGSLFDSSDSPTLQSKSQDREFRRHMEREARQKKRVKIGACIDKLPPLD